MKLILQALIILSFAFGLVPARAVTAQDDQLYDVLRADVKAFARQVSKDVTSELGQAQAIVRWLTENFDWRATDYQKRTVQEIIERKGGNCNELAMVALSAMTELDMKMRRVHEVNIHTNAPERGARARQMMKEKGNTCSVVGRRHNDHVWLELYDSATGEWLPADPSSGLVGLEEWMKGRVGFGKRVTMNPITEDMIVPFAVFAADAEGKFTLNRTQHYLVEEFDRMYNGKLHTRPEWKQWTALINLLDDKVAGAFSGEVNLHEYEMQIDTLAEIYEQLSTSVRTSDADRSRFWAPPIPPRAFYAIDCQGEGFSATNVNSN